MTGDQDEERHTLIAILWPDVLLERLVRLSKVVLEQIEKDRVILL